MAYDTGRNRLVVFGGLGGQGLLQDTWEWDGGAAWRARLPASSPPAQLGHAMAYDRERGRVVLFGSGGTWEWDGNDWQRHSPRNSPSPRAGHAMAFDETRGHVLLFGGGSAWQRAETWAWVGNDWTQRSPASSPPKRSGHSMVWDGARQRVVLFGGVGPKASGPRSDTWEWDGNDWQQRSPGAAPMPRTALAMGYDAAREQVLMYGGATPGPQSDTWTYAPLHPAAYGSFGSGCGGSAGTPVLGAAAGQRPWLGESFSLELSGLPHGAPGLVWAGRSNTFWQTLRLPFDLAPIGMPGCALRVSPDVALPVANTAGRVTLTLRLAADASLVGARFFNQAFVVDRGANPFGSIASNAGEGLIGSK
jgi:hypothetical protein